VVRISEDRPKLYSIGSWTIKPGREEEFIAAWKDFACWTAEPGSGASEGVLAQDVDDPRLFYCFWPFSDEDSLRRWRSEVPFKQFMMRMRAYCETCRPSIVRTVGRVRSPPAP
jgi:heme-degrading monooxygenase HmoA